MCSVDGCQVLFFIWGFSFLQLCFVAVFPLFSVLSSGCSPFAFLSCLLAFVFVGLFSFLLPIFFPCNKNDGTLEDLLSLLQFLTPSLCHSL